VGQGHSHSQGGHPHSRGGHSHSHGVSGDADSRRLAWALALILAFMAAEVTAGVVADSLALLSDAAHMLTDAVAIALALVAMRLAQRPPAGGFTYGMKRAEILSAAINGATLLVLGVLIVIEAVRRLVEPPEVEGLLVLVVALVGIPVNLGALRLIASAERRSLNVEGAFQHILTDLFAFIATAVAGAAILWGGFERADGIASLLVAATMLWAAYNLLRASGRVFMEAAPPGLDPVAIGNALAGQPGVVEVHDLHVWEVTTDMPAVSAHVIAEPGEDTQAIRFRSAAMLAERFGIEHSTLQVERQADEHALLEIETRGG
jgi:cobalt-zinc-cadmium efflux system protein